MLLSDILAKGGQQFADREAVADPWRSTTYGALADGAERVAAWLAERGVRPGDRVLVMLPNSVGFVLAHFGVLAAGAISVPCDAGLPDTALDGIRSSARPTAVLNADTIAEAQVHPKRIGREVERTGQDVAAILYTTGTTGRAKGVTLTHNNTLTALRNISAFVGYRDQDREVVTLPLSHSFGLGHVYCNLMHGGAVYLENGLTRVGRVLRKIEEWGATGFPGTPLGFALLMDKFGPVFVERCRGLRFVVVNSAPLAPDEAARLQDHLPNCEIMVYYGLTEASRSTFISLTQMGPKYYGSVGRPMDGVDLRLSDKGEVLIGGPTVTPGYWDDPELTAETITDGYLHTRDIGRLDAEGNLFITGRATEIINFGGFKVSPIEVESVLKDHSAVDDVCVFGDQRVEAAIVSPDGFDPVDLVRHCQTRLEPFKVPTEFHRVPAIPRSATGKARRFELAEMVRG